MKDLATNRPASHQYTTDTGPFLPNPSDISSADSSVSFETSDLLTTFADLRSLQFGTFEHAASLSCLEEAGVSIDFTRSLEFQDPFSLFNASTGLGSAVIGDRSSLSVIPVYRNNESQAGVGAMVWPAVDSGAPRAEVALNPVAVSVANLNSALRLANLCFQRLEDQEQIVREYERLVSNDATFYEPSLNDIIQVESDFLYMSGDIAVAMGGAYRHPSNPDTVWLSWFGVHPDFRRNGFGASVVRHIETLAKSLNASAFAAYTEDNEANSRCHAFYESLGFANSGTFEVGGETMRIYRKQLNYDSQPSLGQSPV